MSLDAQFGTPPDQHPTARKGHEVAGTVPGTQCAAALCRRKRMVFGISNSAF